MNRIRTSKELATVASYTLSGNVDDAFVAMLVSRLLHPEKEDWVFELAQALAGSVLSNRRE